MFDRYVTGRRDKHAKSKGLAFGASLLLNSGLVLGLLLFSFWKIEKLQAKTVPVVFQTTAAPPPPPPPPAGVPAPREVSKVKAVKPRELVQPPEVTPKDAPPSEPAPSEPGVAEGTPDGVPGGDGAGAGGTGDGPGTGPVVEEPKPINVPIEGVEAARISGTREIQLPAAAKQAIVAAGKHQVTAAVKLCLDTRGVPASVRIIGSTGYPDADARIRDEVTAWRYRPYTVNGQPVPVCTAVMFRYQIE